MMTILVAGGGIYAQVGGESVLTIVDSEISENIAGWGGGIDVHLTGDDDSMVEKPKFIISRSAVYGNHAKFEGGGISVNSQYYGVFRADNTTVSGNETFNGNGHGGGLFIRHQALLYGSNHSIDVFLTNVTITKNVSHSGGGVEVLNQAVGFGIGVIASINNTIISENFDYQGYNDLVGPVDSPTINCCSASSRTLSGVLTKPSPLSSLLFSQSASSCSELTRSSTAVVSR